MTVTVLPGIVQKVVLRALIAWAGLAMLLAACGGGGGAGSAGGGKILAWIGQGESPYQRAANTESRLAYINPDGTTEDVLVVPNGVLGVYPCGNGAASPDGDALALFLHQPQAGVDGGALYQVRGAGAPVMIGAAHALACLGNGSLQYAPDSARLGYIDYTGMTDGAEFAAGTLRLLRRDDLSAQGAFENVTAFQLLNDGAAFVSFFTAGGTQAREAAVNLWMGGDASEIATLYADENCRLTNAEISATSAAQLSDRLLVILGQRCPSSGTTWQAYLVARADGTATRAAEGPLNTQFFTNTRTNNLFPTADAGALFFTLPDGLVQNSVQIARISPDAIALDAPVVERAALMPRYAARSFAAPAGAAPAFSRDGRWLALAVTGQSITPSVTVLSLNAPADAPITITTGDRGTNIPFAAFSPDSSRLFYLAGGGGGEENALFALDMASTTETRLARGRFGVGVPAPDNRGIALLQWKRTEESPSRAYTDLVVAAVGGEGEPAVRFGGLVTGEDGAITERRFAYPLAWR